MMKLLSLGLMLLTLGAVSAAEAAVVTPAQRVERYVFHHDPTLTRYVNRYDALGGRTVVVNGVAGVRGVTLGIETNRTGRTLQNRSIGMLVCQASTRAIKALRLASFSGVAVTDTAGRSLASNIGNGCRP